MRFTIEQIFLRGPSEEQPATPTGYFVVDAQDIEIALADFLREEDASLVGETQRYPGPHLVAMARSATSVFTLNLLPGSDAFRRRL